jgi:hypothetical protein
MAENDIEQPYENTALNFSNLLINRDFSAAYALLSGSLQQTLSLADLEKTYLNMVGNFDTPANNAEVIETLSDWPGKLANDVAWVYVSIDNKTTDAEAVSVTLESTLVNAQKKVTIRSIEWGRP